MQNKISNPVEYLSFHKFVHTNWIIAPVMGKDFHNWRPARAGSIKNQRREHGSRWRSHGWVCFIVLLHVKMNWKMSEFIGTLEVFLFNHVTLEMKKTQRG
jgi:hypothetical protein